MSAKKLRSRNYATWSMTSYFNAPQSMWVVHVLELDASFEKPTLRMAMCSASDAIDRDAKRPFVPKAEGPRVTFTGHSKTLDQEFDDAMATAKEGFGCQTRTR